MKLWRLLCTKQKQDLFNISAKMVIHFSVKLLNLLSALSIVFLLKSYLNFRLCSVDRYELEFDISYSLIFFRFWKLNILHHMHARISEIIFDDTMRENDEGALALLWAWHAKLTLRTFRKLWSFPRQNISTISFCTFSNRESKIRKNWNWTI